MKKILIFVVLFQLGSLFSSCEKEIMEYKGSEGVYFSVRWGNILGDENKWPYQPFSNVDFVRINKDIVDYPVTVTITGPVKNYDRTFGIEINPDSTTATLGKHYEAFPKDWTIPAGAISTTVKIRVMRTPDLETEPKTIGLRLVASPQLSLSFPDWDAIPSLNAGAIVNKFDASQHTLKVNDIMVQPAVWLGSLQAGNKEGGAYGVFTRRKMEFLEANCDVKYEDFASDQTMPLIRSILVASDASAILIKRYNEKNPVLEADGRLMFIGSVPWTSILGVPYVPGP